MKKKIFVICAIITLFSLTSGCIQIQDEGDGVETEAKISFTEFRVADMPTDDFIHVNVTFSEIKLHKSSDNDSGWVNVSMNQTTVDLIYLHINNLTEQLGIAEVEIGNYTKLWIVIDNVTGVLKATNETINFDVPSGILKIQQLFRLQEGNNTITVDIDLNNSILKYGGGEKYKLLPVISRLEHHHENKLQFREQNKSKIKNMVENRAPAIDVVANGSRGKPIKVTTGENITFNASGTYDVEGDNVSYYWDFGDDTNGTGAIVIHSYAEAGSYWVELTVSDGELESTELTHVTVKQQGG